MATKRIKTENVTYILPMERIGDFLAKIIDLTRINDLVKFTFSQENLLIYSLAGKNDNIHAFKSYVFPINQLFDDVDTQLEAPVSFILSDAKKVAQVLRFYQKFEDSIEIKLFYNEDNFGERLTFKNAKLKDEVAGSPPNTLKAQIDLGQIKETTDTSLADYSFTITKKDFDILKAKSTLEKANDIFYLNVKDKKLYLGENRSTIYIADVECEDNTLAFPKKYFNTLNFEGAETMQIWVFETFIFADSTTTNLLITTELTV